MDTLISTDTAAYPWDELVSAAIDARNRAYAPYSAFSVGAAIFTPSHEVYRGANVENASFGLTICAERVAMTNAITAGQKGWLALVVASRGAAAPCGACRQFLAEFAEDACVGLVDPDEPEARRIVLLSELLPYRFAGKDFQNPRKGQS